MLLTGLFRVLGLPTYHPTHIQAFDQRTLIKGKCHRMADLLFFCLDSAALLMLNEQQIYLFGQIQTSQTGYQLYSDTSPYGECSLVRHFFILRATSTKGIFILPYLNILNGLFTLTFSSDAHVSLEMTSCMMQPT